ncbi:universal stress protein [Streptococcus halichoeri]|uniref:universal stress protein n=1 Tax=Streptococcus halichoeri TaxID=254785 RepID=UPI001359924F|nr:universal stress protein [Streptococcus halichoeri]
MTQHYQRIMVAIDGSYESELAVEKAINVALRNQACLLLTHIIDVHAYQNEGGAVSDYVFDRQEQESADVLAYFENQAKLKGLINIKKIIEIGNPKTLLAKDIPLKEEVDLIMVGATGLNTFERLIIGSTSEYLLRHAKVDMLVVRDKTKTI